MTITIIAIHVAMPIAVVTRYIKREPWNTTTVRSSSSCVSVSLVSETGSACSGTSPDDDFGPDARPKWGVLPIQCADRSAEMQRLLPASGAILQPGSAQRSWLERRERLARGSDQSVGTTIVVERSAPVGEEHPHESDAAKVDGVRLFEAIGQRADVPAGKEDVEAVRTHRDASADRGLGQRRCGPQ